ncbi:DUF924 family protein [Thioalkalivibrio sp. XN8]|uniref:DUF924 family protein n=1 Tax=Thioalkalivibrio sp. XN8 TaxID=2712863 RepID=UPI0013EAF05D|nr:DUF924 family protein [Thioalkalivibrio sp. XN8]NGP53449.1 DUF924 domain-containing protein [Thioalkalivibrio sp. XN8]
MYDQALADEILDYWFGDTVRDTAKVPGRMGFWFGPDPERDAGMRERWGELVIAASEGKLDFWTRTPRGRLAVLILLDQMRRNIYRGTAEAFRRDGRARYLMRDGVSRMMDLKLAPIERVFFYMPLQHAESLDDQELAVDRFLQVEREVASPHREIFAGFRKYAQKHRDIIARFGRFPHRNAILGRRETGEEAAWLAGGGERFGQLAPAPASGQDELPG